MAADKTVDGNKGCNIAASTILNAIANETVNTNKILQLAKN